MLRYSVPSLRTATQTIQHVLPATHPRSMAVRSAATPRPAPGRCKRTSFHRRAAQARSAAPEKSGSEACKPTRFEKDITHIGRGRKQCKAPAVNRR